MVAVRAILHETITGEYLLDLPLVTASWTTGVCVADDVTVVVPGYLEESFYEYMVPKKFTVTLVEDSGLVRAAGALRIPDGATDRDGLDKVSFPGAGPESIYEARYVLPYPYLPLVDSGGYPVQGRDTKISGVEYGTMMKRLYQQAMTHPGGGIPVAWEPDRPGVQEGIWAAVDGHQVQGAVEGIAQQVGGPEWDWVPMLDDNDRLSWAFITGTDAEPEITSTFWHTWQSGGEEPSIRGLSVKVSPEFMNQTVIVAGGKDNESVMLACATGTDLIDAGIPLIEVWDSSNSSESNPAVLASWAQKLREDGNAPVQYWSFDVRADHAGALRHGDWCTIDVFNHWLVPNGSYERRVVQVSGEADAEYLSVTVAGAASW